MSQEKSMLNAFDPATAEQLNAHEREMVRRREKLLGNAYRLFYERPLHFVRGEGVRLFDAEGRAYLDAYNNVASVGHCHPRVVQAMNAQARQLNTHTRYLHDGVLDYAERLLQTFPGDDWQAMFTCTGSEANDLALRVARKYTGGTGVVVTQLAYHGVTASVAEVSPSLGRHVPLGLHARTVAAPDTYRTDATQLGENFTAGVQAAIDDMLRHGIRPAALLVDTIFSSDGIYADPPGFLQGAVDAMRAAGGLFIADEVQAGFGRTGSAMWGFMRHGLVPDLVTMGKPMGNGQPIAGLVGRPDVLDAFGRDARYFNTFGGNPVSCAAAMAVLDVIRDEELQHNAADVGRQLRDEWRSLAREHEVIGDVRGDGLFIGIEFVDDRASKHPAGDATTRFINAMREERVLLSAAGAAGNVVKLRPPLPFSHGDADELLSAARKVLRHF